ncbi:hypothetical protein ACFVH6_08095 [Spirillospora sp. NPDC127200]
MPPVEAVPFGAAGAQQPRDDVVALDPPAGVDPLLGLFHDGEHQAVDDLQGTLEGAVAGQRYGVGQEGHQRRYTFLSVINDGLAVNAPTRRIRPTVGSAASALPRFPFDTA